MKTRLCALLATLALPLSAAAANLPAALANRQLSLANADGTSMGTVQLEPDGAAQMANTSGHHTAGKWQVAGDRICVQFPPRKQACWGSAKELEANGHATMTNLAGKQINVTIK